MATRWGIISTGKMANDFATVVSALPKNEHQMIAVAEWQLDQAQEFANKYNIQKSYAKFEDLAQDSDIEIVYIAIVNTYHYQLAKLMLNHGKHVLVEKPMTLCAKQTEELTRLARSKGLFLMEGLWPRFLPSYRFVRKQISDGAIGEVYHVNANIGSKADSVDRITKKELGGGTVVDMGVYCIDIVAQVYHNQVPEQIKCIGHLNAEGVDIDCSAAMQFDRNRSATITSHSCLELPREMHICGTQGYIRMHQVATSDDGVWRVYLNNQLHEFRSVLSDQKYNFNFLGSYGVNFEVDTVRKCLLEGLLECPEVTHQDSIYLARIEDELRRQLGVVYDCDLQA